MKFFMYAALVCLMIAMVAFILSPDLTRVAYGDMGKQTSDSTGTYTWGLGDTIATGITDTLFFNTAPCGRVVVYGKYTGDSAKWIADYGYLGKWIPSDSATVGTGTPGTNWTWKHLFYPNGTTSTPDGFMYPDLRLRFKNVDNVTAITAAFINMNCNP